jgi:hypothetical protein
LVSRTSLMLLLLLDLQSCQPLLHCKCPRPAATAAGGLCCCCRCCGWCCCGWCGQRTAVSCSWPAAQPARQLPGCLCWHHQLLPVGICGLAVQAPLQAYSQQQQACSKHAANTQQYMCQCILHWLVWCGAERGAMAHVYDRTYTARAACSPPQNGPVLSMTHTHKFREVPEQQYSIYAILDVSHTGTETLRTAGSPVMLRAAGQTGGRGRVLVSADQAVGT